MFPENFHIEHIRNKRGTDPEQGSSEVMGLQERDEPQITIADVMLQPAHHER
jgi:hypothetical protein